MGERFDIVKREWNALPEKLLLSLVHSMPRRIRAVIKTKGGHTKYYLHTGWIEGGRFFNLLQYVVV